MLLGYGSCLTMEYMELDARTGAILVNTEVDGGRRMSSGQVAISPEGTVCYSTFFFVNKMQRNRDLLGRGGGSVNPNPTPNPALTLTLNPNLYPNATSTSL